MTLQDEQKKVQQAMGAALSGLKEDPWLARRVLAKAKGEEKMGKKRIGVLVLVLVLVTLAVLGTGYALFSSRIAEFFGQNWGTETGKRLEDGKIAEIGEKITIGGVEFKLEEIAYSEREIYGMGTLRAVNEKDVLIPFDAWLDDREFQGEGKAYAEKAKASGGRLLVAEILPDRIGVDEGTMLDLGGAGFRDVANADGTVTFSFQAGNGFVVNEGTSYQISLESAVWAVGEDGEYIEGTLENRKWTVSCVPVRMKTDESPEPIPVSVSTENVGEYETVVPEIYAQTGTMPVRRAVEGDLRKDLDPAWFSTAAVLKQETVGGILSLADYEGLGQLAAEKSWLSYASFKTETGPMTEICQLADIFSTNSGREDIPLEKTELDGITLEEAQRQAEEVLSRLGLGNYVLRKAADLTAERIGKLAAEYERNLRAWNPDTEIDFSMDALVGEEGFWLLYQPQDIDTENCSGRYSAKLYVNRGGIAWASIGDEYRMGEELYVPDSLLTAADAVQRTADEIIRGNFGTNRLGTVKKVILNYVAVRAENPKDGMVFTPAWTVLYTGAYPYGGLTWWTVINAADGTLIDGGSF